VHPLPLELKARNGSSSIEDAFVALLPPNQPAGQRLLWMPPRRVLDAEPIIVARKLTRRFGDFTRNLPCPAGGEEPPRLPRSGQLVGDQSGSPDRGSSRATLVVAGSVQVVGVASWAASRAEDQWKPRCGSSALKIDFWGARFRLMGRGFKEPS